MLLLILFAFSFLFRAAIIFHNPNPPSSDIGLHGSIINLILDQGILPNWNPYHMGGETLATPPGFHFFVTTLILLTGMELIFAELITAAFYSSIIVFPAYIVAKKIWRNSNAGLFASFFAAISALSLEMISWGGYTNIVSLFVIITIFYLFIKDTDTPRHSHLVVGAILFGCLIITHTFTLVVVFPILGLYLALMLMGNYKKLQDLKIRNLLRFFGVSIFAGAIAVSPWILRVFGFYVSASSEGAATGGLDNKNLILTNRAVDSVILLLIIVVIPAIFMFRSSRKKPFDNSSLFLIAWFIVPIVMTQGYLFGVVTDYSRFMYFIDFPGILIISAGLFYLFRYTGIAIKRNSKINWKNFKKALPITGFMTIIFILVLVSPWSIVPENAMNRANYYSTIHEAEESTLKWISNNTSNDSILVADHLYGWWLGGIGKRVTLSAAELEFLIYSHELEVAKDTQLLLDTNYFIDNGLIQVREDGGFVTNKSLKIGIDAWDGKTFPIFSTQDGGISFEFYPPGAPLADNRSLSELKIVGTPNIISNDNNITFSVQYEDELFIVNRNMTVKKGIEHVELTYNIIVKDSQTILYHVWLPIYVGQGSMTLPEDKFYLNVTIPEKGLYYNMTAEKNELYRWFGFYYWDQVFGQVIFKEDTPAWIEYIKSEPTRVEMKFLYNNTRNINIKMQIGVFSEELKWPDEVKLKYLYEFLNTTQDMNPQEPIKEYLNEMFNVTNQNKTQPITVWDYNEMINDQNYNISYVISRDKNEYLKFAEDPKFRLILNSGKVAVFQVIK
ncbi:hypothetical protein AC477_05300 [miscellaneous Crenarchaeota group-1 archaeon SG8-32-1]|uniref:Uncharacterized protein n=1 Tax=miscellaneous Crenarchaeota group-1 archaeon SG8-32-1 TaxID=1685124 RepID=A0A0M0BNM9_9ARCH|nr:MAG: hypothetical protein AC477_05300 [miscellaneous Crenarchaeota group-1 archaeon SG8-32-1]